jgi:transposase
VNLVDLPFITRVPESIVVVKSYIDQALAQTDQWREISSTRKIQVFDVEHYGIKQRWCVVASEGARNRSENGVERRTKKEAEAIEKELFHLQAQRFSCEPDARQALEKLQKKWKYHQIVTSQVNTHRRHEGRGRPKAGSEPQALAFQVTATVGVIEAAIKERVERGSCYVVATNIPVQELSDQEVVENYSSQQSVERGFRFLKDPVFFVSSLFVKKPCRVQGLLMVMTLSLLVYAIAERRLRRRLAETETTLPNQIKQETATPTLRWTFQMLLNINCVTIAMDGISHSTWSGLTDLRKRILRLFGTEVMKIYGLASAPT